MATNFKHGEGHNVYFEYNNQKIMAIEFAEKHNLHRNDVYAYLKVKEILDESY